MNASPDPAAPASAAEPFALDAIRVDPAAGEIVGPGGREQLDPKVMEVLRVLHAHRGKLVARESLFHEVWPDRIVTDDVLSRCIYQLRRQLAQVAGPGARELVETLPKRGYRLRAAEDVPGDPLAVVPLPVAPAPDTPAGPARAIRALAIAALGALAVVAIFAFTPARDPVAPSSPPAAAARAAPANSIAVLPFADMSEAKDQAYLAEGLAEELLATLARTTELPVTARTSSFSYRDRTADVVEIARALGVAYVVEGSVRKAGDRLRITADLVDARDGRRVWSQSYDRTFGDALELQDEIAASVARALEAKVSSSTGNPRSQVAAANEAYLLGRFHFNRRAPGDVALARQHFERAVAHDPSHAQAWAGLAGAYAVEASPATLAAFGHAVERALATGPELPEVHARAMDYYSVIGDDARARFHRDRVAELDPDAPLFLSMLAGLAHWEGRHDDAVALQRRVVAQDPVSAAAHANLAGYLITAGDYVEARAELAKLAELVPSEAEVVGRELALLSIAEGRPDEAWRAAMALPAHPDRDVAIAMLGESLGEPALAAEALARLTQAANGSALDAIRAAEVHAHRGEIDRAYAMIALARPGPVHVRGPGGDSEWMLRARTSPFLEPVRRDPRWRPPAPARLAD